MSSDRFNLRGFRRVSVRLTLWHSLIVLSSILALLWLSNLLLRNRAYVSEQDTLESRLAQYTTEYQSSGLPGVMRLASLRKGRAQKAFFVRVADEKNKTLFLRDQEDWVEFDPEQLSADPAPAGAERIWRSLRSQAGTELLLVTERMSDGGILQIGKTNEDVQAVLSKYRQTGWWMVLIFVPASFAGGAFLASRALRPVQDLTQAAQGIIQTGRFNARVPARGSGDELDDLVKVFNEMLERIEDLVRNMRDSLDNVAHDLRTPIMRLSQKAQNLIEANEQQATARKCPNCDAAVEALSDCVEESDRVTSMLNTLMEIAETEAGLTKQVAARISIRDMLQRTVEAYSEFAEDRGVRVLCSVPTDVAVQADETALSRVFSNLLDNSIKYTPSGGTVQISTRLLPEERLEIRFTDTGIGIAADDLPRIWDRLFRADRSRSERGLGLGLSFVRAIVESCGGSVSASSREGRGTTITVVLPLARKEQATLLT